MSDPQALWANLPPSHRNLLRMLDQPYTSTEIGEHFNIPRARAAAFLYRLKIDRLVTGKPSKYRVVTLWRRTELGDQAIDPIVTIPHYGRINVEHDHEIVTGAAE